MAAGTSHTTISIKLNEQGFHDIFNKYYVTLCLFANQYTENQETSADIVQDSFAKLWQIREDFFYLHQVKAFLYTAVRNKALNELEHSKVVYEYAQNVIEKKKDSFFHDAIVEEETYRIVSEAIDKLPDQMKAIMQLALADKKNLLLFAIVWQMNLVQYLLKFLDFLYIDWQISIELHNIY